MSTAGDTTHSQRSTGSTQLKDDQVESHQDCNNAQNKAVVGHSSSTAPQGLGQCSEETESGVLKTQTSGEDGRPFSSKGLADVIRNNPDPHSPIWLPGLDYPAQYCVRQTRSMSQVVAPHDTLEDMELPSARRRKSVTERSTKKHTVAKNILGSSDMDNSMNDVSLCVGSCQSGNGISGTSRTSEILVAVQPRLGNSGSYLCTIRTPGGLGECCCQLGASSREMTIIGLQVSDLGCVKHENSLGCWYSGMKC